MSDELDEDLKSLRELERQAHKAEVELRRTQRRIKESLLAGAAIELGARYAELRLLPGKDPVSKDPDDYELVISFVS